ncbi:MAG: PilT/PilU family type 4a pilus ATPase [Myxococcales bacterium]|nr:PilT/PilU family type 4a pilus ATPase [Myxococcales bacterium]
MVYRARQTPNGPAVAFRPGAAVAAAEPVAARAPAAPAAAAPGEWGWPTEDVDALLSAVVERRAADLLLSSGREARVRIMGGFERIPGAVFDDQRILAVFGDDFTAERRETLEHKGNVDLAYQLTHRGRRHRFRVNVFRQMDGLAAAFRPIWDTVPTLQDLNLPPQLLELAEFPYGLVLMTGPTGSGKSTTLATLIEHLNRTWQRHIVTLEDPIEYVFSQGQSIVHQREVGHHVHSFATGLRAALREAPDVILVGEMRDLETIAAALTAAETGHLVLSTLHSGSAAQAIDRIIDIFPEHQQGQVRIQLADVLRAIVTQRLLPRADRPGRIPAIELVKVNYAFSNLIRDKRTHQFQTQIQTGRNEGMIPFDVSLVDWVRRGAVDPEVALRAARDRRFVEAQLADHEVLR